MATLAEQRRAIQEANTKARRASDGADARRASGRDMVERRTGQQQVDDINAFLNPPRPRKTLRPVEPRGPLLGQTGTGTYTPPPAGSPGGGIASPLTEKTKIIQDDEGASKVVPDRDYYAGGFTSSDGLFVLPAISVQRLTDANGAEVQFLFANPQGTVPPEAP